MRIRWLWMKVGLVGLAIASPVFASSVFTEGFESYGNLVQFADLGPDWYASPDGTNDASPATEWGVGLPGVLSGPNNVGIQQGSRAARWAAHEFNWADPAVTGVVMGMDFETNWNTTQLRPYQNRYLGWMVNPFSVSSGDIFGVYLDGSNTTGALDVKASFRNTGNTAKNTTLTTLNFGEWNYETFYRLRLAYSKTANDGVQMDVSLTKIDADGTPEVNPLATAVFSTDVYNAGQSASQRVNPAQLQGPMWLAFINYNAYAGNADNVYLEIIPEPATALLLACGGLILFRRKCS